MTEPKLTRLQRAWSAWLDSTGDDDGATNAELGGALADVLTVITRQPEPEPEPEPEPIIADCQRCGRPWSAHPGPPGHRWCRP